MYLPGLIDRKTARPRAAARCELVVDNFAGAGGASMGIEAALDRAVDIAVNHDAIAIQIHQINHPQTDHLCEDVWQVDPLEACKGRPVGLAWFSPDCTHFSTARGGKPVQKNIRCLAWVVIKWAKLVKPRVIILENVREFQTWGPLGKDNKPIKARSGETFRRWKRQLQNLGYQVEHRELVAADYGVPTTRKRFFLIARCDGEKIVWPRRTHAPRQKCEALGLKPWRAAAECIDWSLPCPSIFERKRPLAEATLRRIARGIERFVVNAAEPFIVTCNHGGADSRTRPIDEPMHTVTAIDHNALVTATLMTNTSGHAPSDASGPVPTLTSGQQQTVVTANMLRIGQTGSNGGCVGDAAEPVGTVVSKNEQCLATAHLTKLYGTCEHGADAAEPMPTITGQGGHVAEVRAFLMKYYKSGSRDSDARQPMHTLTAKARMGLVTIHGQDWQITDIGLRMLTPDELLRAQFGRFAADYVLVGTQAQKVAAIGNSVCPELAEALVRANVTIRSVQ
ncbi:MAG TPA: DNA cytosine methyltransferase [Phycisphaerae bacterium]|nr:DNA cytosine methyltransferase [Phycisphaerae bacterium]